MKIHLTKSTKWDEGYISTLTDSGESLYWMPISWFDDAVKMYQENKSLEMTPAESKEGYEQTYIITDKTTSN